MHKKLLVLMLGLLPAVALAATLRATWNHPTTFTDGTPLPLTMIANTRVQYGDCAADGGMGTIQGETLVVAPTNSIQVTVAGWGDKCMRAYTRATAEGGGGESGPSAVALTTVFPTVPNPPTFTSIATVVYDLRIGRDGVMLARAVGTAPYGSPCGDVVVTQKGSVKYYEISPELVSFSKPPKSAIVVVSCQLA